MSCSSHLCPLVMFIVVVWVCPEIDFTPKSIPKLSCSMARPPHISGYTIYEHILNLVIVQCWSCCPFLTAFYHDVLRIVDAFDVDITPCSVRPRQRKALWRIAVGRLHLAMENPPAPPAPPAFDFPLPASSTRVIQYIQRM